MRNTYLPSKTNEAKELYSSIVAFGLLVLKDLIVDDGSMIFFIMTIKRLHPPRFSIKLKGLKGYNIHLCRIIVR